VRRLVEFVDDAPVFRTGASGGGNAREQVRALERWVDTSVARAGATDEGTKEEGTHEEGEGIQKKYPHGSDAEATAEGALWIYRVAFDELTRQVSSQCRDRGALLAKVWDHFFSIVEMRAGLRYEGLVTEARERAHVTSRELEQSRAETDALNTRLQELDETLARTRTLRHRDQTTHDMTVLGMEVKARDAAATQKSLREDIAEHVAALRVSRELEHALRTDADVARVRIHDLEASVHNERVAKDTIARHLAAKTEETLCLSAEVARLNDVVTERDDSVKALTVALHASALSLDAETSRATTLTRELDDTTAALAETRAAADASAAAYAEQTERLQSSRVEAGTLRERLEDAHAARRALDLDLHDARVTIDAGVEREASLRCALDEGVEALKLGRVERAEDRSKFDDVVANLNASLDDAHAATRDSRGRVSALVSELAKVREVMHDLAGSVRTLGDLAEGVLPEDVEEKVQRKCTEKVQAPESALESAPESVAADVERGRALMRRVINRLDAHRKELGDAVRARDVARSRLYEAHDIIAAAERDVTSAKLSILRLEKDVETRDEAIVTRRHDIANLRRTCVKHVEDAKVAAAVLLGEETKVMELRSAVARHERDKKTHAATVDDLHACRAELDASTDTNGRLVTDVQRLETAREALEAGKHAAEGRIAQLTSTVTALQDDLTRLEDLNRHERLQHERLLTEERERLTASAERSVDNVTRSLRTCETRLGVVEEDLRRTKARASVTHRLKVGLLSLRCGTLARRLAASEVASVAERETHVRDMLAKEKATTELVREVRREQLEWAAETSEAVADVSVRLFLFPYGQFE
jgi:chromosome segregation ATPase